MPTLQCQAATPIRHQLSSHTAVLSGVLLLLVAFAATYQQVRAHSVSPPVLTFAAQRSASTANKLPAADKIVEAYLKAIGGKKRVAAIRDATYEWTVQTEQRSGGNARTQTRAPASFRSEINVADGQVLAAANAGSAWTRGRDGKLRTLTGDEATAAK